MDRAFQPPGAKRAAQAITDSAKSDRGIIPSRLSIGLSGRFNRPENPLQDRLWSALRNAGKTRFEARNPGRSLIYDDRSNYCFRRVLVKRIGMGIVGAGFVGPHHIDAVRRLGFVDVVAIAGSSDATARAKADSLGVPKAYGSYDALLNDPDVQVVHNATPNYLHYPVNAAAIAKGKHVVSDKPLAMTAAEAKKLVDQATKAGIVHAVTFNYRGNPLVQQARHAIARGDIGKPHFLVGHYLQDWLLKDTDYSWRLEPDKGGASSALGDIGSHWCDLAQHISGLRITEVLGDITTVIPKRKRPKGSREAFAAAGATRRSSSSTSRSRTWRR